MGPFPPFGFNPLTGPTAPVRPSQVQAVLARYDYERKCLSSWVPQNPAGTCGERDMRGERNRLPWTLAGSDHHRPTRPSCPVLQVPAWSRLCQPHSLDASRLDFACASSGHNQLSTAPGPHCLGLKMVLCHLSPKMRRATSPGTEDLHQPQASHLRLPRQPRPLLYYDLLYAVAWDMELV